MADWGEGGAAASQQRDWLEAAAMNTFSAYVFRQALTPLLAILGGLAAVAVLTQGFNELDLLSEDRQGLFAFVWVTLLTLPQAMGLVLPFAMFAGTVYALQRMRRENEISVAHGAGISIYRIASPILQLAFLAALAHLTVNALVQPAAFREIRHTLYSMRANLVAGLVREGDFTHPAPGLTLYVRERAGGGQMHDVMIDDRRGSQEVTYTARNGAIVTAAGAPAFSMIDGQAQRQRPDGSLDVLDFDRYALPLGLNFSAPAVLYLKTSDRYLNELFFPDLTSHFDQDNLGALASEGNARLASPLLDIALALIAVVGVLTGQASRRGYSARIAMAAGWAGAVRLGAIGVQAAAVNTPALNAMQYALPLLAITLAGMLIGGRAPRRRRRRPLQALILRRATV